MENKTFALFHYLAEKIKCQKNKCRNIATSIKGSKRVQMLGSFRVTGQNSASIKSDRFSRNSTEVQAGRESFQS